MNFQIPKDEYTGKINTLKLGKDKTEVLVGGEAVLPFYSFEGELSNKPVIALDVFDMTPTNWPEYLLNYFKDVTDDPIKWAKKCIKEFGADAICFHLTKINPEIGSMTPEKAGELVKSIREAIGKPLIVYAATPLYCVAEVIKKESEKNPESNILLGWV